MSTMTPAEFRKELVKIMPGYSWTVHKSSSVAHLEATGIKSSGFNRLSTLCVVRQDRDGVVQYEAKSAGSGTRSPFLHASTGSTLARALRELQVFYEQQAAKYAGHGNALKSARECQEASK